MANKIQIKRSTANATVTGLANGELAFTQASNTLFIGAPDGSGSIPIGGKLHYGVLTANHALVANSSSAIDKIIVANLQPTAIYANGSLGTAGYILASGSTGNVYWINPSDITTQAAGDNTQVQFNNNDAFGASAGFTFNSSSNNLFVGNSVFAKTVNAASFTVGIDFLANATTVAVGTSSLTTDKLLVGTSLSVNTSVITYSGSNVSATSATLNVDKITVAKDVTINGNTTLGDSGSDIVTVNATVSSNLMPTANNTYYVGNNTMRWAEGHFGNVHSTTGYFDGRVSISGDLVVTGNVTTTDVNTVIISDPLIYLAGNNYSSDLLDIGFAANYNDGQNRHTGLFRDATDKTYRLFDNLTQELSGNNTIDIADATFRLATLQSYLQSGGLTTTSTSANLVANSTFSVGIVANTLTLSSPLAGTSGGTGLNTYTNQDILVANSTNGFSKLSLGSGGFVLQSNGSALVYDSLDGGTF